MEDTMTAQFVVMVSKVVVSGGSFGACNTEAMRQRKFSAGVSVRRATSDDARMLRHIAGAAAVIGARNTAAAEFRQQCGAASLNALADAAEDAFINGMCGG